MTLLEILKRALKELETAYAVGVIPETAPIQITFAALRQAIANEALIQMAVNARELGLDYEPPITMQAGELDCTHAERLCTELNAAWKLVPIKPTIGQLHAALECSRYKNDPPLLKVAFEYHEAAEIYKAMLDGLHPDDAPPQRNKER